MTRTISSGGSAARVTAGFVICAACATMYLFFSRQHLIPDVAWIIEASRRWTDGAELYRDIIEVNPPLIFYETVVLTGGLLTAHSYIGGVCIAIMLSALWVLRLRGPLLGLASACALLFGGLTDFGQRDHLGLIFVVPVLLGSHARKAERCCLGLWAFFGIGLKPYLLPVPIVAAGVRAIHARSARSLFSAEMITLGVSCLLYVLFVRLLHPAYFAEIVPLGRFVYWAYGANFNWQLAGLSVAIMLAVAVAFALNDKEKLPLAAATAAAVLSYYLQARFWSYHFVPGIGLGILLSIWLGSRDGAAALLAIVLCLAQIARGPAPQSVSAPVGASSVAILSDHVYSAYPAVLEHNAHNATRYPALWTLPGAWNIAHDPSRSVNDKQRAITILKHERSIIRGDIIRERPKYIYADASRNKQYFNYPFDYMRLIGPLPNYRRIGTIGFFEVWELQNT